MSRIKVMLIEDDYYSRYAFYSLLSKDRRTTVIDEARDVDEAQWLLQEGGQEVLPDVILVDVDLFGKDRDPVEAILQIRQLTDTHQVDCRVLCCMMEPTLPFIRAAIEAGVDGILKKEEVANGIADIVEKVVQDVFVYTRSVSDKAFGRIEGVRHPKGYLVPMRQRSPLTRGLRRVARLYCEDSLSAAEVAEILHLSESGVRRQIQKIYRALGVHNRQEARQKLQELE
jgi:two-component system response regulator DesR